MYSQRLGPTVKEQIENRLKEMYVENIKISRTDTGLNIHVYTFNEDALDLYVIDYEDQPYIYKSIPLDTTKTYADVFITTAKLKSFNKYRLELVDITTTEALVYTLEFKNSKVEINGIPVEY